MNPRLQYILIFSLIIFQSYGQQLQKKIEIIYDYRNQATADTLVTEYDREGFITSDSKKSQKIILAIDTLTLDSSKNFLRRQILFSDSSEQELTTYTYPDSALSVRLSSSQDTLSTLISNFQNGDLIKTTFQNFEDFSYPYQQEIFYDQENLWRTKKTSVTIQTKGGQVDTVKIIYNKLFKTRKEIVYNSIEGEWYFRTKTKYRDHEKIVWETFYHDTHQDYFTTRIVTKFNKDNLPTTVIVYDETLNQLEKKKIFKYEFYDKEK